MPLSRNTTPSGRALAGTDDDLDRLVGGGVLERIADEIGDQPPEQAGVPQPDQVRAGLDRDPHAIASLRPERPDRVADDVVEADRLGVGVEGPHRDA